jgi:hypothetical protein
MEPAQPRAEAVAVRDGRFIAVGSRAAVAAAAGQDARLDETFAGKVVVPGFIEPDAHPVLSALTLSTEVIATEDWETLHGVSRAVRDAEEYQERLLRALADHHRNNTGPFISWGYHEAFHGELSRALLDKLLPGVPVIIWHRSCRELYLNTAALARTGINAQFVAGLSAAEQAGVDLDTGHLTGLGTVASFNKLAPILGAPQRLRRGLELVENYLHRNGITLACEPGALVSRSVQASVNAVFADSATPFDHCFIADGMTFAARYAEEPEAMIAATRGVLGWGEGRTRYLPEQVQLYTDGDTPGRPRLMPETDAGSSRPGAWIMAPEAFDRAFQAYWDAGYQIRVQHSGDAGLDLALATLERAMQRSPREDHRTLLVGLGFASPKQLARWGGLDGSVSANLQAVTALTGRYAADGASRERANEMVPMAHVLEYDIPFALHSAMPMAPAQPIRMVWAAVNRLTPEGRIMGLDHRLPREAALRGVTLGAARALRQEDEVGSIAVGKRANLTILEASPLDVPPTWIKDIPIWGTMLDGRLQPAPAAIDAAPAMPASAAGDDDSPGSQ